MVGKVAPAKVDNRSTDMSVEQNQVKDLKELHKEWSEDGVRASRATTQGRQKSHSSSQATPELEIGLWSKLSFQRKVKSAFPLESKIPES